MGGIEGGEGDVAGGAEDDGDDVVLAGAEAEQGVCGSCGEDGGGEDLGREVVRVGGEIAEEALEVCGCGVRDEGGGAPVVEEGVGRLGGGCEVFDEELARAKAGAGGWGDGEEGVGRAVLLSEAGLELGGVGVEGGDGGGRGFGEKMWGLEKKKCSEEERQVAFHGDEFEGCGRLRQCKRGNAGKN